MSQLASPAPPVTQGLGRGDWELLFRPGLPPSEQEQGQDPSQLQQLEHQGTWGWPQPRIGPLWGEGQAKHPLRVARGLSWWGSEGTKPLEAALAQAGLGGPGSPSVGVAQCGPGWEGQEPEPASSQGLLPGPAPLPSSLGVIRSAL